MDSNAAKLFGVCGIYSSIDELLPGNLPFYLETILIPFKDKIIYDSFFKSYNISFGRGICSSFNHDYKRIKQEKGIVERLTGGIDSSMPKRKKRSDNGLKSASPKRPSVIGDEKVPLAMVDRYNEIAEIIGQFCDDKLNEELKVRCWRALAKLAKKRPSPICSGRVITWAAGISYAIGSINFVFDRSKSYYLSGDEFADWFEIPRSSIVSKASNVKKLLNLSYFSSEFTIKNMNFFPFF
jgi:hypothetical protein